MPEPLSSRPPRRHCAVAAELLEPRRLLTGTPTLNVTGGPAALTQGTAYTLNLSASEPINQWVVNWGDGAAQTLPGATTSVTHAYPLPPAAYGIGVTARTGAGDFRADVPASLDAGFGAGGVVTSDTPDRPDMPRGVAVQRDGKIVTVSTVDLPVGTVIAVTRYNPDGTPDPTFGAGGRVLFRDRPTAATASVVSNGGGVAIQSDGRIVVAGTSSLSVPDTLLFRLLPDGSPDPSFGPGGQGYVLNNLGGAAFSEKVTALALAPDGTLVAGVSTNIQNLVVRFRTDGSLDPTFGVAGVLTGVDGSAAIAVQSDGKVVILPNTGGFSVARFNANGTRDNTFDGDGYVSVDFNGNGPTASSLALGALGSIFVTGTTFNANFAAKLTATGALDATFANGGRLFVAAPPPAPGASSQVATPVIRPTPDGRVLIAGVRDLGADHWEYLIDRYNADGTPDADFGPGGRFAVNLGNTTNHGRVWDVAVLPDGAPAVYVETGTAFNMSEAILRLTPAGLSVRVVDAAAPLLGVSAPATTAEGATYTLGLTASDPDGDGITETIVNWGDGTVQRFAGAVASATHVYPDGPSAYVIKASVIDGDRSITSVSSNVGVTDVAPTITVTSGPPAAEGSPFTVQFGATDPGQDTISLWGISWGDGIGSNYSPGLTSASHVYQDDGTYVVTVKMTNEDGIFPGALVSATITNVPPTIDPLTDRVAAAAATFTLAFTARDAVPEIFGGSVNWGDGTAPTAIVHPGVTPLTANAFRPTHAYASRGTYDVTVTLTDGDGGSVQAACRVTVGDAAVHVFDDTNGNGAQATTEPNRAGAGVFLDLDNDAAPDAGEPTGITDAFGDAMFDSLAPGTYAARVVAPAGWHVSAPAGGVANVTPGTANAARAFGLTQVAAVTGALFNDANGNGVRDGADGALASTSVLATALDSTITSTVVSNASGAFRFDTLPPGRYLVSLAIPASRTVTAPAGRRGYVVTVTGDSATVTAPDLGSTASSGGTISGSVYRDLNGNGTRDGADSAVTWTTVYLDVNDNGLRDPDEMSVVNPTQVGTWSMPRVAAGTYRVRLMLPPGSPAASSPGVSRLVTVAAGQTVGSVELGRPYDQIYYVRRNNTTVEVYGAAEPASGTLRFSGPASNAAAFLVSGSTGDDWIIVDWAYGSPLAAGGLAINGQSGTGDTLTVVGTFAADAVSLADGQITVNGAGFGDAGIERLTLDGGPGLDDVTVSGGPAVVLAGIQDFGSLNVAASAKASLAPEGLYALVTRGLTINGTLDLAGNALVLKDGSPDAVRNLVARGYHGGDWLGTGLTSSSAAADSLHRTALGYGLNAAGLTSFAGIAGLTPADVLVRYTLYADATLDRTVGPEDFNLLASHFGQSGQTWATGDFDYDGVVGPGDFNLLASRFGTTLAPPASGLALASVTPAATSTAVVKKSAAADPAAAVLDAPRRVLPRRPAASTTSVPAVAGAVVVVDPRARRSRP